MEYLILGIVVLAATVAVITIIISKFSKKSIEDPKIPDAECCGAHEVCDKGLKKADPNIQYFDDEELDHFAGRQPDDYNDEEIDMFRDILYTVKREELEDWLISLEKRNIELPNILRPEAWNMLP
ncbi:MAG: hypothetical protein ACRDDZ_13805 [Marinifilaceae bacterium]